jgi:aspartate carbamoyltransferase catalytic subunit
MPKNRFYLQDILSSDQFTKDDLQLILSVGKKMKKLVETKGGSDLLKGKLMTALFYEPSSRTYASFIGAMQRLGGGFIPVQGVAFSSVSKGENLEDTIRTFGCYSDIVVLRHPEVGAAKIAAEFCEKPVVNAGDGVGEHPTQSLLDFFTICDHFGSPEGLTVTMVGDLLNGRTIHSLSRLLSLYNKTVRLNLVSPEILKLPKSLLQQLEKRGTQIVEKETLEEVIGDTDVMYVTRVQKERFTDLDLYEKLKHHYLVTPDTLRKMKKKAIVMHPLPRVGEISMDVDLDKRAVYITEQMRNGMYVRMALLALILLKEGI